MSKKDTSTFEVDKHVMWIGFLQNNLNITEKLGQIIHGQSWAKVVQYLQQNMTQHDYFPIL